MEWYSLTETVQTGPDQSSMIVVNIKGWGSSLKDLDKFILMALFKCKLQCKPGRIAQLITCLTTDARLTADPEVASSIPARSHTFVEIDHEIISTVILPSADSFKKVCCQLQAKVCAQNTG